MMGRSSSSSSGSDRETAVSMRRRAALMATFRPRRRPRVAMLVDSSASRHGRKAWIEMRMRRERSITQRDSEAAEAG